MNIFINKSSKPLLSLLLLLGCTACIVPKSPPSVYYILESKTESQSAQSQLIEGKSIALLPVSIPEYMDRTEIVTHNGNQQLDVHKFDLWGESLPTAVTRLLTTAINQKIPAQKAFTMPLQSGLRPDFYLRTNILRLEATLGQDVEIEVQYSLENTSGTFFQAKFVEKIALNSSVDMLDGSDEEKRQQTRVALAEYSEKLSEAITNLSEDMASRILTVLSKQR